MKLTTKGNKTKSKPTVEEMIRSKYEELEKQVKEMETKDIEYLVTELNLQEKDIKLKRLAAFVELNKRSVTWP
jgi:intracellular sulfur oxidation DsrE/DsrF family protein